MEHTTRTCDYLVKKRGRNEPHGTVVSSNESTIFVLDDVEFSADLCDEHLEELHQAVQPFVDVAVQAKVTPSQRNGRGRIVHKSGPVAFTSKDVRIWLEEQGRAVAPSGRIRKELIAEYEAAHSST